MKSTIGKILAVASVLGFVVLWAVMIWWTIFRNDDAQLTTFAPAGPNAESIQNLVWPIFAIAGVVFVAVLGVVVYAVMRFRDKGDDAALEMPEQLHGKTGVEVGWTIAPAVILAVVGFFTVQTIIELNEAGDDPIEVEVFGQQWWWGYRYDVDADGSFNSEEDVETATEMVIPVGRDVDLTIISNDVIHSFWIPALNGKRDAVPGNPNTWRLNASEPGVYRGQCTEFCGLSHANMRMLVRAVPAEEYDRWIADQQRPAQTPAASDTLATEGKAQWDSLCASCHLIDGVNNEQLAASPPSLVSSIAPDLTHLMSRGTFAGSIVNLHYPDPPGTEDRNPLSEPTCTEDTLDECGDPADPSLPGNPANPVYTADLEQWLRDPESIKPMAPDEGRGMPNLGLTEDQINQLVAYLTTLE